MVARRAALTLLLAGALAAGCGEERILPPASGCTGSPDAIVEALAAAPAQVELEGSTTISACVDSARDDAALQNVGVAFSNAAEELEARALDGDADAALQLGYLVGAVRTGSQRTSGVSAELVRRIERSAAVAQTTPGVAAALERGMAAGARRG